MMTGLFAETRFTPPKVELVLKAGKLPILVVRPHLPVTTHLD